MIKVSQPFFSNYYDRWQVDIVKSKGVNKEVHPYYFDDEHHAWKFYREFDEFVAEIKGTG